jgi:transposase InsO family protein
MCRRPGEGCIHHSDRGVQYASNDYPEMLKKRWMTCSMSRKADLWDNSVAESFFFTLVVSGISFPETAVPAAVGLWELSAVRPTWKNYR